MPQSRKPLKSATAQRLIAKRVNNAMDNMKSDAEKTFVARNGEAKLRSYVSDVHNALKATPLALDKAKLIFATLKDIKRQVIDAMPLSGIDVEDIYPDDERMAYDAADEKLQEMNLGPAKVATVDDFMDCLHIITNPFGKTYMMPVFTETIALLRAELARISRDM